MLYNKPKIYNTPTIYKTSAGGGGGGNNGEIIKIYDQYYRVIDINGKKWLGENLKFATDEIEVGANPGSGPGAFYYSNDYSNWAKFGLLYTWNCIPYIQNYLDNNNEGWEIPSKNDFENLMDYVGNDYKKLKINSQFAQYNNANCFWLTQDGTDDYGFGMVGGGFYEDLVAYSLRANGSLWTKDEYNSTLAAAFRMIDTTMRIDNDNKRRCYSLRLIFNG